MTLLPRNLVVFFWACTVVFGFCLPCTLPLSLSASLIFAGFVQSMVTLARWPKKCRWRMISRGLQLALQNGCHSWQIRRMQDPPAALKTKIGQLVRSHDPFSCARCEREKRAWLQLFMMLANSLTALVLKRLYLQLRGSWIWHSPSQGVSMHLCFDGKKKIGVLPNMPNPACAWKYKYLSFLELFLGFAAAITVVHVVVGPQFPRHAAGHVAYGWPHVNDCVSSGALPERAPMA